MISRIGTPHRIAASQYAQLVEVRNGSNPGMKSTLSPRLLYHP
jgi:hypothetical protein